MHESCNIREEKSFDQLTQYGAERQSRGGSFLDSSPPREWPGGRQPGGGVVPNPRHCTKILPGGRGWDGGRAASVRGLLGMPGGRSASVGNVAAMARDGAGEVLASPVCPHVSGPGAGSRGGGESSQTPGTVRKYSRAAEGGTEARPPLFRDHSLYRPEWGWNEIEDSVIKSRRVVLEVTRSFDPGQQFSLKHEHDTVSTLALTWT